MSLPATMKAITYAKTGDVDVLELTSDYPFLEVTSKDILIKVAYGGVNFVDTLIRSGKYSMGSVPGVIGVEVSGTIVQLPTDQAVLDHPEFKKRNFAVGLKVAAMKIGSHSEYIASPWTQVVPVPEPISLATASAVYAVGMTTVTFMAEAYAVKPGDTIFIHTIAGGLGLIMAQFAKTRGATVIGTTSSAEKAALARDAGADHVINYKTEDTVKRVLEITSGKGVDVVFDGVGKDTFESNFEIIAAKGTLVSLGSASGDIPPFSVQKLTTKNLKICRPSAFGYLADPESITFYGAQLFDLVERGAVSPHIHKEYPFTAQGARDTHNDLTSGATSGKLIVRIAD